MQPVEIIHRPVEPYGHVVQDDCLIERIEYGAHNLIGSTKGRKRAVPDIEIEIAQHDDGLWMWGTSSMIRGGYRGYRVGPKWGKFARTREDAIAAACNEIEARNPEPPVLAWLESLCAPEQLELFA